MCGRQAGRWQNPAAAGVDRSRPRPKMRQAECRQVQAGGAGIPGRE